MLIVFRTHKLEREYENAASATRAYGPQVAWRYIQRINLMQAARDIEDIKRLPGLRCHQLAGERAGQWAVNLTGFYRLIFTLEGDQLEVIMIEEVSKHYGD